MVHSIKQRARFWKPIVALVINKFSNLWDRKVHYRVYKRPLQENRPVRIMFKEPTKNVVIRLRTE
jgi:hypothetical protein